LENAVEMRGDLLLAGVDAGTSATKACLFRGDGTTVAEAGVPVEVSHPAPGLAEQPAEVIVDSACEALRAVATAVDPRTIGAIGITGQMGGLVLVDDEGVAVSPHISWLDGRAAPEVDRAMASHGDGLLALGGLPPYLAPKAAWWRRKHPDGYERVRRVVMPAGYLALRLAGLGAEAAVVDRSSSGFVGLHDVQTGAVVPELCELWGVSASLAPRVVPAGAVVGSLGAQAARRTGLSEGVPLVAAPGDGPCGWLGVGAVDPGVTVDTAGTSDHVGICGTRFVPDVDGRVLICLASGVEGLWHMQGYTSGTGLTHRWFLETFPYDGGIAEAEKRAAAVPPGSEELVFVPHFGGRVCPYQPAVAGVWVGLTWRHGRGHLYRSLLESVAYEYACYLDAARQVDSSYAATEVRVIGGGAASELWTRIKADALGVPFAVLDEKNYTCWGAALAAGAGIGVFDDLGTAARSAVRVIDLVRPDGAVTESYRGLIDVYRQLYPALDGTFRALWERRQKSSQRAGF
jgi:xylulokinase